MARVGSLHSLRSFRRSLPLAFARHGWEGVDDGEEPRDQPPTGRTRGIDPRSAELGRQAGHARVDGWPGPEGLAGTGFRVLSVAH